MGERETILGKDLMAKWDVDEYELLQRMKQGLKARGSFNTQVEIARLTTAEDIPADLSLIPKLQFEIEIEDGKGRETKKKGKSITPAEITEFADEGEKQLSDSAKAKKNLCSHVTESVRSGLITCKDDLFKDPVIQTTMSNMNWSIETVERYTRNCGIPKKKLGRPKAKNGTNTP